jgi:hypothetical protein
MERLLVERRLGGLELAPVKTTSFSETLGQQHSHLPEYLIAQLAWAVKYSNFVWSDSELSVAGALIQAGCFVYQSREILIHQPAT